MIRNLMIAALLWTAVIPLATAQDPWSDLAAIEAEMARQLWISDTVIGYHDLANHIGILQGQISAADADAHLKSLGAWFFHNEAGEAQLTDARNRLNAAIAGYLSIVSGPAFSSSWPGGAQQQTTAQSLLTGVNNYYPRFLQSNLDPTPLVMQIALVAGWMRGEANVGNPFFGHLERIRDAYPDPRTRARIIAGRGPLKATDGSSIPASPAANSNYSPGAELAAMQPLPTTPPTQDGYQEQQQPPTDFFDDLRDAGLEMDTDRPGMDITSFDLSSPDPAMCMTACQDYGGCAAFTYVKPGVQGTAARCWLKSGLSAPVQSTCCISGTP